jgi:hypothetical protein
VVSTHGAVRLGNRSANPRATRSPDEFAINTNTTPACSQTDGDFFKSGNKEAHAAPGGSLGQESHSIVRSHRRFRTSEVVLDDD